MGFLDDLTDSMTDPQDHPSEAAMFKAIMEGDDDFEQEFDEADEPYS